MRSAFTKDIFREIKGTLNRFIAILAIVALGVGFFAGLKATTPDMQHTADVFYNEQNFMDVRLLSTMGFTDSDVHQLAREQYVKGVMPTYSVDLLLESDEGDKATHVMALSKDPNSTGADNINRPILLEGRYPEKSGECVIDPVAAAGFSSTGERKFGAIGNTVVVSEENESDSLDMLKTKSFEVVGTVQNPLYVSFQRGNTNIGGGTLEYFMMIPEEDFDCEYYLEMYVTVRGAENMNSFSSEYEDFMEGIEDKLETFADERAQVRYDDIVGDAEEEIGKAEQEVTDAEAELAEGQEDYDSEKARAEQEFADAEQELSDAQAQIEANQKSFGTAKPRSRPERKITKAT